MNHNKELLGGLWVGISRDHGFAEFRAHVSAGFRSVFACLLCDCSFGFRVLDSATEASFGSSSHEGFGRRA